MKTRGGGTMKTSIEKMEASHRELLVSIASNLRKKANILSRERHFMGDSCDELAKTIEDYLAKTTEICDCCEGKEFDRDNFECYECHDPVAVCTDCKNIVAGCRCGHCVEGATFHEE